MAPIDQFIAQVRRARADGYITKDGLEQMRQMALHVITHDFDPEIRQKLADALADPPDVRSFATDSGITGRSRPF